MPIATNGKTTCHLLLCIVVVVMLCHAMPRSTIGGDDVCPCIRSRIDTSSTPLGLTTSVNIIGGAIYNDLVLCFENLKPSKPTIIKPWDPCPTQYVQIHCFNFIEQTRHHKTLRF